MKPAGRRLQTLRVLSACGLGALAAAAWAAGEASQTGGIYTCVTPDGRRLFTGNGRAGTVSIIDLSTSTVSANVTVGKRAWGVALSPDERTLYVANGPSDDVSVVDVAGAREIEKSHAGKGPWGIAVVGAPLPREKEDKQ